MWINTIYKATLPFRRVYRKIVRRKGFGIHSPFAFQWVKNVIEEKYAYYVYEELSQRHQKKNIKIPLKEIKLLFRLSLFFKPEDIIFWGEVQELERFAIEKGLEESKTSQFSSNTQRHLIYVALPARNSHLATIYQNLKPLLSSETMLIFRGIDQSYTLYKEWKTDIRFQGKMSMDLLHYGIIFYSPALSEAQYIVGY